MNSACKPARSTRNVNSLRALALAALGALYGALPASATPVLSSDLASFTVLGASTVTNVPTSTIAGNVGVGPGTSITGFNSVANASTSDSQVTGTVESNTALANNAQADLTTARTYLSGLGSGLTLGPDLTGLPLAPGFYTVLAGTTNLSRTLVLDALGLADATWVFQTPSTLITSPNSVVQMTDIFNSGSGYGVYWNVGSAATIDTSSTFLGNVLALDLIAMNTSATDNCGRVLSDTKAVTLDHNTLDGSCTGLISSGGLSGEVSPNIPPGQVIPEPASLALVAFALAGLAVPRPHC